MIPVFHNPFCLAPVPSIFAQSFESDWQQDSASESVKTGSLQVESHLEEARTWKSLSEGLLMRLPMESASEKAEFEISETLLLREWWWGMLPKESARWWGVASMPKRDILRPCPGLPPLAFSNADLEISCCGYVSPCQHLDYNLSRSDPRLDSKERRLSLAPTANGVHAFCDRLLHGSFSKADRKEANDERSSQMALSQLPRHLPSPWSRRVQAGAQGLPEMRKECGHH